MAKDPRSLSTRLPRSLLWVTLLLIAGCGPKAIEPEFDLATFEKAIHWSLYEHLPSDSFSVRYDVLDVTKVNRRQVDYQIDVSVSVDTPADLSNCPSPDQLPDQINPQEIVRRFLICPALLGAVSEDGVIDAGTKITLPDSWRFTKELRPDGYAQSLGLRWIGSTEGVQIIEPDTGNIIARKPIVVIHSDEPPEP